jgi:hypothetical protein
MVWLSSFPHLVLAAAIGGPLPLPPGPDFWNVDDLKIGQKGFGKTVMQGVKLEQFEAEVIGVLKNTSPGRDLVLCRLSGLNLERTGVIQGMSGSPIYIDGKLLGAVAYAWPYGKEPIAGVTPFSQMFRYAESSERRSAVTGRAARFSLPRPIAAAGRDYSFVEVHATPRVDSPPSDALVMVPLHAPLAVSGFSPRVWRLVQQEFPDLAFAPVQSGAVAERLAAQAANVRIEPGAALSVSLMVGDFDMSGIGTVTHVEGSRVYGWGHPFMSLGSCDLPLMTGWVHTVYPRTSISFKFGSPLKIVGAINTDVSTGIAGWLGRQPDLLPLTMRVRHEHGGDTHSFQVRIVRHSTLLPPLVLAALTNSIDLEGEWPVEGTIAFTCRIDLEGYPPIIIKDSFAGPMFAGSKAPPAVFTPVSSIMSQLLNQPTKPIRIKQIDCETEIRTGRDAAEIEGVELESLHYAPGETVRGHVYVRPYKGQPVRVPISLKLPIDLPDGEHTLTIVDEVSAARQDLRTQPQLLSPHQTENLLAALRLLTQAKRTHLVLRLALPADGVAMNGQALTDLPSGMVHLLSQTRRTPVQLTATAISSREPTPWVLYGQESVKITVARHGRGPINPH